MKKLLQISIVVVMLIAVVSSLNSDVVAQCALCKANAESSLQQGDNTAKGLNAGIMYLLIIPYVLVAALGYWWYTRMRRTEEE